MPARRSPIALLVGCALAASLAVPVQAQAAPDAWASSFELGFTGAAGNASFSILTAAGSLERVEIDAYELALSARIRYGEGNGDVIANDARMNATFDWAPEGAVSPFLLSSLLRDGVRNLDARIFGGAGVKWTFWQRTRDTKASFSAAALVEHERFASTASDRPPAQTVGRFSGRTKVDVAIGPDAVFQQVTFWQPRFTEVGDYILDVANAVETGLVSTLSLAVTYDFVRESVPPPGARPNDHRFGVVLRMRF